MGSVFPVVMSGGSGTRLWPLSRQANPKQFRALVTDKTMLEETVGRLVGENDHPVEAPIVICGAGHGDLVDSILNGAGHTAQSVVLEPIGRNTAPVAIVAALEVLAKDKDGLVLLLPADHHVIDPAAFRRAVGQAVPIAEQGYLTTFGIKPTHPETGYGYIRAGAPLGEGASKVAAFVEKPNREKAQTYLDDGHYAWNAGIFLYRADRLLEEAQAHIPEIATATTEAWKAARREGNMVHLDTDKFAAVPSESIDYGIMERTSRAAMIGPVDMGWNDVGSWQAVSALSPRDGANVVKGDVVLEGVKNSFVLADGVTVAAIGVEDLIIVATGDAVLVTRADRTQDVKKIVDQLKAKGRSELL
ncbi:mannose-1-phosphate guanylyltransferase/mannose-6-phosphate isomerase [Parvularcula sp. LCG005]|uniref:mannose-1-phosphate guanylyltransferase/mannose-6-phosphate isomerase n=1 Tax=Parvularcula sp. LCG005 TaxID=3078805 RepID=UPI002942FCF9|nr:mannose-1-phosphate guanylyltransferase/mannose-6-phosphate isomerase [Parvularcula sp. LCG005]WOI52852.1 mannose-1-phosphate guanylyltransferase/mannose-6-phosphate isomerase [Parvularcula sp. LCG005]